MANVNSRVIYDGRNTSDTDDIIVIVTGLDQKSINGKTKDMAQVFILNRAESPTVAVVTGSDQSVCGSCFLRPIVAKQLKLQGESNNLDSWLSII